MEERRQTQRHRTLKGASIVFNEGRSAIDCTVRNLSDAGANLRVTSILGIPDNFTLQMSDNHPGVPGGVAEGCGAGRSVRGVRAPDLKFRVCG